MSSHSGIWISLNVVLYLFFIPYLTKKILLDADIV